MAVWIDVAPVNLRPVDDQLAEYLKASTKLFMDETPAPVLDTGRGRTKTGYLWALARDERGWGGNDLPGAIFFYEPGRGGKAWGRIASLIETAKMTIVEPFAYLKATLEVIARGHTQNRIDDLLPSNVQQASR